jgi:hypothetical protein
MRRIGPVGGKACASAAVCAETTIATAAAAIEPKLIRFMLSPRVRLHATTFQGNDACCASQPNKIGITMRPPLDIRQVLIFLS